MDHPLDMIHKRSARYTTLAALAVTCRTFREPALVLRWRLVQNVKSFISLFPCDVWVEFDEDLDFARLPSKEEWIRFESYTSRIREIHIVSMSFKGMLKVMATLSMKYNANPSHHLFPNLQTLAWESDSDTEVPFAHLFFPPSLRCLTVDFDGFDDFRAPGLLLLLENQCPILKQFTIRGLSCRPSILAALRLLETRAFQQLEYLHCNGMDETALRYIAKLATLKDLSVYLPDLISADAVSNGGFVNLQTLCLTVDEEKISAIIPFLPSTRHSLKSLEITMSGNELQPPLSMPLQQLFSRLSAGLCHTCLTQFHILDVTSRELDIAALRPLFSFSKLKYVRIDGLCSFDFSDESLAELADAWPHLEELVLNHRGGRRTSEITFKGLKSLIRACPLLQILALAIDATQLNVVSSNTPEEDIHNDKIEELDLKNSIIENPTAVALILGELFWSLKRVDVYHRRKLYGRLWSEVNSHLLTRQANKQEIGL
ncbi:hypothetical protein BJ138DRAFT_1072095 [Hygrophoropsis aurantiaca]|uniref:Uncharacterized protein n=1 Tax=Hygrophoropsis aurantiaca TaxID=72124 RepID=A0ACB7ZZM3_9AGAM|nr:hypothetical protein BJ138DRAFT_1072095 [Hygrophoropsis aurantiaca]